MITVGILTISDRCSRGEREDKSGDIIRKAMSQFGTRVVDYAIVPDNKETIVSKLTEWSDKGGVDLIITTGGTGLAPRDVTPEATLDVVDRLVPGFPEAIRAKGLKKTPHAMLSREISGVRKETLIINLPGSPRAVRESLPVVLPALPHAIEVIKGEAVE
ncbi:MAG: MogA/MoaB family molybdenum cofactor biosynthesis protein [Dehalococcoidia bacterium]|nr:MogA/MoaB family molybdenum cofactor biosynthesis protein [Dehalococcoidia bacterium]